MKLSEFMEVYFDNKQNELKERTMKDKRYMMEQHIIPYYGNQMMSEITAGQIIQWQNELQTKGFSEAYLRMIQNQLTSLFTHASRIYDLHKNSCKKVKRMGSSDNRSLDFWIVDEYQKFIQTMEPGSNIILSLKSFFGRDVELESCWHLHQRTLILREIKSALPRLTTGQKGRM